MKEMPLVSVLIVTYNSEKYILKTIQSCLNQTYLNFEILLLDNSSTNNTVKIIKSINSPKMKLYKSNTMSDHTRD